MDEQYGYRPIVGEVLDKKVAISDIYLSTTCGAFAECLISHDVTYFPNVLQKGGWEEYPLRLKNCNFL